MRFCLFCVIRLVVWSVRVYERVDKAKINVPDNTRQLAVRILYCGARWATLYDGLGMCSCMRAARDCTTM